MKILKVIALTKIAGNGKKVDKFNKSATKGIFLLSAIVKELVELIYTIVVGIYKGFRKVYYMSKKPVQKASVKSNIIDFQNYKKGKKKVG